MRWPLLTSLLLPLPFAVLPLVALLMTSGGASPSPDAGSEARVVLTSVTVSADDIPDSSTSTVASSAVDACGNDLTSTLRQGT